MSDERSACQRDEIRIVVSDLRFELIQADPKKRVSFDNVKAATPKLYSSARRELCASLPVVAVYLDLMKPLPGYAWRQGARYRQADQRNHDQPQLVLRAQPGEQHQNAQR